MIVELSGRVSHFGALPMSNRDDVVVSSHAIVVRSGRFSELLELARVLSVSMKYLNTY